MEEQNQKETVNTAEELKKEAVDTAKEVKEAVKNTDIKQDVNKTKGFLSNLFKNPIKEIETVANSSKNEFLKIAIIVLVVWLVAIFINSIIGVFHSYSLVSSIYTNFGTFFRTSVKNVCSSYKICNYTNCFTCSTFWYSLYYAKRKQKIFCTNTICNYNRKNTSCSCFCCCITWKY